ncbi:ribosome silencing factor [Chloroflexota bacterium]
MLEGIEVARLSAQIASDKQASDIMVLDARNVCSFTDYFVLATTGGNRQTRAVYDEITQALKQQGVTPHHHEGRPDSGWLLIDYGDVIIHIFSPHEREYYQMEEMWHEAAVVLQIQ